MIFDINPSKSIIAAAGLDGRGSVVSHGSLHRLLPDQLGLSGGQLGEDFEDEAAVTG